ncbi:MAG: class I SAM-dependent methyltransferase [Anaerolineae bacterium]|jgi:23S rRNA (cytosine1962-C5)-methyltransferase|nr:class I SAM-dependent methyltransferase [Anaerolineae bacterium]
MAGSKGQGTGVVVLKPGKEKPVVQRHPWVFSGAVARVEGKPADGDVVLVADSRGQPLARGGYNSRSQICVRIWTWDPDETVDAAFFAERLRKSWERRESLRVANHTTAYRLVNAESDLLPGLVVDRYGDFVAVQFLTLAAERWRNDIVDALVQLLHPSGIYERSDVDVRRKEGLQPAAGLIWGKEPPDTVEILEHGRKFLVDIKRGQKTGFYLDQRENRRRVAQYATDRDMLNCFCYTGGFSVYAGAAGALRIVNVDTSRDALALARRNMALNGLAVADDEYVEGDVFQVLRAYRDQGRTFDLVVLDPPKFAVSQAQVQAATRGYKDINLLAMQILRPGGILATFSCSGLVSPDLFQKVVFGASVDAGRDVQILEKLTQASDHPILLSFPESEYLKGFICRVI